MAVTASKVSELAALPPAVDYSKCWLLVSEQQSAAVTHSYKWNYADLKNKVASDVGQVAVRINVADTAEAVQNAASTGDHNMGVGCQYAESTYAKQSQIQTPATLNSTYLNRATTSAQTVAGKVSFSAVPSVPNTAWTDGYDAVNLNCLCQYVRDNTPSVPLISQPPQHIGQIIFTGSEQSWQFVAPADAHYLVRSFKCSDGFAIFAGEGCVDVPYIRSVGGMKTSSNVLALKAGMTLTFYASVKCDLAYEAPGQTRIKPGTSKFAKNSVIQIYQFG